MVHHNLYDSRPKTPPTKEELVETGNGFWPTNPISAAKLYLHLLSSHHPDKLFPVEQARIGSQVIDQNNRNEFFSRAYRDAQVSEADERVFGEIDALKEWAERSSRGEKVPLPAEFVDQRLRELEIGSEAVSTSVVIQSPEVEQAPHELAA